MRIDHARGLLVRGAWLLSAAWIAAMGEAIKQEDVCRCSLRDGHDLTAE